MANVRKVFSVIGLLALTNGSAFLDVGMKKLMDYTKEEAAVAEAMSGMPHGFYRPGYELGHTVFYGERLHCTLDRMGFDKLNGHAARFLLGPDADTCP